MREFRAKLGENGRILIPAYCRHQLQFEPSEELIIRMEGHELRIFSTKHALTQAQALVKKHAKGRSLVSQLKNMRKEDLKNEK